MTTLNNVTPTLETISVRALPNERDLLERAHKDFGGDLGFGRFVALLAVEALSRPAPQPAPSSGLDEKALARIEALFDSRFGELAEAFEQIAVQAIEGIAAHQSELDDLRGTVNRLSGLR